MFQVHTGAYFRLASIRFDEASESDRFCFWLLLQRKVWQAHENKANVGPGVSSKA